MLALYGFRSEEAGMNRQSVGPAGPLSLYAQGFQESLEGRGYAPDSVRWRLRQLAALDRWLCDHHLAAGDLDAGCVAELVAAWHVHYVTVTVLLGQLGPNLPISPRLPSHFMDNYP
jgi:hypothetical protein